MIILIWIHHTCPSLTKEVDSSLYGSNVITNGYHMDSSLSVYVDSTLVVHNENYNSFQGFNIGVWDLIKNFDLKVFY